MGTDDDFSARAFEVWLKTNKNSKTLKKIAAGIYGRMERNKLNLPGVDLRLIGPDDIFQELMIFLLQDENARMDLLVGSPGTMKRMQGFLWHRMLDKSRSREENQDIYKNTWRLFYRHITEVMGQSDQFVKIKPPSGPIVFGRTHQPARTIILMEDLMGIAYPEDVSADFQTLNTRKNILQLAGYFWDQAALVTREPDIRLSVREFMEWIGQYVTLENKIDSYPETNDSDENKNNPLARAGQEPEDVVKIRNLTAWAQNFYHLLKGLEKKIFYYYECKGLTHEQVSRLMDKKGTQSYQRDKIRENLKAFLRPLDWISPGHDYRNHDPDDFIFFRDQLCSLLSVAIEGQSLI